MTPLLSIDTEALGGIAITDPTQGKFEIAMTDKQTGTLRAKSALYDVVIENPGGQAYGTAPPRPPCPLQIMRQALPHYRLSSTRRHSPVPARHPCWAAKVVASWAPPTLCAPW